MQPDQEHTEQGFVDQPLPRMPDGDADPDPQKSDDAAIRPGADGEQGENKASAVDEPTA